MLRRLNAALRVAAFVPSSSTRTALRVALGDRVSYCPTRAALVRHLRRSQPDAVVMTLVDERHGSNAPLIAWLRVRHPDLPLIGTLDPRTLGAAEVTEIPAAVRAGLHGLVSTASTTLGSDIVAAVDAATDSAAVAEALRTIDSRLSDRARSRVRDALIAATRRYNAAELSVATGEAPRSLTRALELAGLPPPARLLAWCRMLLAARALVDADVTVSAIARRLGYSSAKALRVALRTLAGMSPAALRTAAGQERFREALLAALTRRLGASRRAVLAAPQTAAGDAIMRNR